MKKRQRKKVKVGTLEVGVDALKNGAIFLTGFGLAEKGTNELGKSVAQLDTTMAKAAVKTVLATLAGVSAIRNKDYKSETLSLAAGMAASAVKDVAVMYLPGNIVSLIPSTTPMVDASNNRIGLVMAQRSGRNGRIRVKAA